MSLSLIIKEDIENIYDTLKHKLRVLEGATLLISGGGGFLGAYFMDLIDYCNRISFKEPCKMICIENFITGVPDRIKHLKSSDEVKILQLDVTKPCRIDEKIDYIIHCASIASPTFYRKYPIETIESNVTGLKNLLDLGLANQIKSMIFFSTSEIYGNPTPENIPTPETYNGNVSCTGPRACYDESKRLGETLCVNYYRQYGLPVKIVRPFNVYGPGLRIDDKRVIPDFFYDALYNKEIKILSNGAPTRSFCYISDAIAGFMSVLLSDFSGEAFNIGNDQEEISMLKLAELIGTVTGGVSVEYSESQEADYLTDNPQRRCPDISKAKQLLDFSPEVHVEEGLQRLCKWYRQEYNLL